MIKLTDIADIHWTKTRATKLQNFRNNLKLSLRDLTNKMKDLGYETNRSTLHYIESGKLKKVNLDYLEGICKALNVKMSEFVEIIHIEMDQK